VNPALDVIRGLTEDVDMALVIGHNPDGVGTGPAVGRSDQANGTPA